MGLCHLVNWGARILTLWGCAYVVLTVASLPFDGGGRRCAAAETKAKNSMTSSGGLSLSRAQSPRQDECIIVRAMPTGKP